MIGAVRCGNAKLNRNVNLRKKQGLSTANGTHFYSMLAISLRRVYFNFFILFFISYPTVDAKCY